MVNRPQLCGSAVQGALGWRTAVDRWAATAAASAADAPFFLRDGDRVVKA